MPSYVITVVNQNMQPVFDCPVWGTNNGKSWFYTGSTDENGEVTVISGNFGYKINYTGDQHYIPNYFQKDIGPLDGNVSVVLEEAPS